MSDMSPHNQQRSAEQLTSEVSGTPSTSHKPKSLLTASLLALFLGWLGAHRFYLGHTSVGLIYLFSLGGLGFGVLMDLSDLPGIVARANSHPRTRLRPEDIIIDESDMRPAGVFENPLGSSFFLWSWIKYSFFFLSMFLAPYMYYEFFGDITFAVIIFLLYFVAVYNGWFATRMADREFIIWKIPGVRSLMATIVNGFAKLRRYYAGRPPIGWFHSIFSIFYAPFRTEIRKEWKLFNGLLAFGIFFVALQYIGWIWEYITVYYPELTAIDLFENKIIIILISAVATFMLVIPTVRTLIYIELAGDVRKGRFMLFLVLPVLFILPSDVERYSIENYMRLEQRLTDSELFSKKFDPFIKKFIQQNYQPHQFSERVTDDGQTPREFRLRNSRLALATSMRLTRLLRQQLVNKKIVIRSEVNGLRALAFDALLNGEWHPGLLIYASYGTDETGVERTDENNNTYKELDWHILKTEDGISRRRFIPIEEVELLYRVLLGRMESMGQGDQLSPDFKGKTL